MMVGPVGSVSAVESLRSVVRVRPAEARRPEINRSVESQSFSDALKSKVTPSDELVSADQDVKAHEHAHMSVLGPYAAGAINYTYITLPDGSKYAVGGSIKVDLTPVPGDPEATIRKARAIINASYAVSSPSPADMRVAAQAYQMEMQAQRELEQAKKEESKATQEV
ncbi:putative metalloprotease CJM1_0395 family protein [Gracilinema caldarium]|uniref:putative metalloprotease CJM1_0395 family protein n=1 Tax=Gracilinema caldarium TaxID=215591 RepID=UPI0026ED59FA|nr:putative metalloprotease CJM1_0395 family protein [Gracilinema caldarium]